MIGSSLLWEIMLWLSVSASCIRYSKRHKFRPKMRQNAFGGRVPPGHAGELERSPAFPSHLAGSDPMRFGMVGRAGPGMRQVVGLGDR